MVLPRDHLVTRTPEPQLSSNAMTEEDAQGGSGCLDVTRAARDDEA
jgi:hypothetical protein